MSSINKEAAARKDVSRRVKRECIGVVSGGGHKTPRALSLNLTKLVSSPARFLVSTW